MYRTADGEEIFIVDGHVHFWDGSPGNQKNRYAEGWVECFYNYHKNLSPAEYVWPLEQPLAYHRVEGHADALPTATLQILR